MSAPSIIGKTMLSPGVLNIPYTMPKYSVMVPTRDTTGDLEEMDMPAGSQSVLAVRAVRPAAKIVADFIEDGYQACARDAHESVDED
jgi:enoyl-[acyl-carrier protein] reductase II